MTQYMNLSAHASAGQCAHQASSCASFGFLCSAFFGALHFFCFSYFNGQVTPQEACVLTPRHCAANSYLKRLSLGGKPIFYV